jgi:hypothetical protein
LQGFFDAFGKKTNGMPDGAHFNEGDINALLEQWHNLPAADRAHVLKTGVDTTKAFLKHLASKGMETANAWLAKFDAPKLPLDPFKGGWR